MKPNMINRVVEICRSFCMDIVSISNSDILLYTPLVSRQQGSKVAVVLVGRPVGLPKFVHYEFCNNAKNPEE